MFRRRVQPTLPPEWLIVGLGNPGPEYKGTRHNVGFEVIDALADKHRIKLDQAKHQARLGIGSVEGTTLVLVKPLTFMNLSGRSVAPLMRQYNLAPDRILVIADDLDLSVGKVRMRPKGSAGGHNGHKSLIHSLGTDEYPRIKIGIGKGDDATISHVLGPFSPDERGSIDAAVKHVVQTIEVLCSSGLDRAMEMANRG